MFSVVTKYHKGRHSLFLYNLEIFYAFTQDILRSPTLVKKHHQISENSLHAIDLSLTEDRTMASIAAQYNVSTSFVQLVNK